MLGTRDRQRPQQSAVWARQRVPETLLTVIAVVAPTPPVLWAVSSVSGAIVVYVSSELLPAKKNTIEDNAQ